MPNDDLIRKPMRRENVGCTLVTLASIAFLMGAISFFKTFSFDDAQEQVNELRNIVATDMECDMLDAIQEDLDRGMPASAHRKLEQLKDILEKP